MKVEIKGMKDWLSLSMKVQDRFEANPKPFVIEMGEPDRSKEQNKLIHGIFKQCADKSKVGKPAEWWKNELKSKLGKKEVHFDLEENPTIIITSTKDYKKPEISDFIEKIRHHMAEKYQVQITLEGEIE